MSKTRDMTKMQFAKACVQYGFEPSSFGGGYFCIHKYAGGGDVNVYARNGGDSYREMLAYLKKMQRHDEKKREEAETK